MTQAVGFDWYILIDGKPSGPVPAAALASLVMQRKLTSGDLVWCEGLASWMPVGAVLGASEQPAPRAPTHTVHVEAAERRATAHRVASLSQLYVENLAERKLAPLPSTASSRIVEAHDAFGGDMDAYESDASVQPTFEHAGAQHLADPYRHSPEPMQSEPWQPELAELARLVEVSEAGADWSGEDWTGADWRREWEIPPRPALGRPQYG